MYQWYEGTVILGAIDKIIANGFERHKIEEHG